MKGFSVVICCYNGSSRIRETLIHLFGLNVASGFQFEVLLINNNSTDDTVDVAKLSDEEFNLNQVEFRIVHENIPGLSAARRRGILESTYEFVLFCDDDNHLENNYLVEAFKILIEKPEVGIIGGWCKPKLPFYPGKWIEANYAALAIEPTPRAAGYVDWVFGAGMVIKKDVFVQLKNKGIDFLLTDRVGSKQTSGGDAEICQLAKFIGFKIYYSPALILHHSISSDRLTKWSFIKANYRNVFMIVYFFLLNGIIKNPRTASEKLYSEFMKSRIQNCFYYMPRFLFGRNSFYSFIMLYQNVQLVFWLLLRSKQFTDTYFLIRGNLNIHHGRK